MLLRVVRKHTDISFSYVCTKFVTTTCKLFYDGWLTINDNVLVNTYDNNDD